MRGLIVCACLSVAAVASVEGQRRGVDVLVSTDQSGKVLGKNVLPKVQQQTRVSIEMRNSTKMAIIKALAERAQLKTTFVGDMKALETRTDAKFSDVSVIDAIREILRGTGLDAKIASDGVTLMIRRGETPSDAPQEIVGNVTGVVIDSGTRKPLNGVTITVVGTKLSTTTTARGAFSISEIPAGSHDFLVKALGYRSLRRAIEVKSGETVRVNFEMTPAAAVLSDVVTTATGIQERRSIGNDITVLNVDSIVRTAPVSSLSDILETRVPGLTVIRSSGVPGAPVKYRLRGIGGGLVEGASNTSNDPIFIVDGIRVYGQTSTSRDGNLAPRKGGSGAAISTAGSDYPTPSVIEQLDWNTIETIEVFKGPSATSQWGADAANGVIVITTKKGLSGKTQASASLSVGMERMMGSFAGPGYFRFGRYVHELSSHECSVLDFSENCAVTDSIIQFQALDNPGLSPFGTGIHNDGSVSMSGGSNAARYSLTGSVQRIIGYLKMPKFFSDLYRREYERSIPSWMSRPTGSQKWSLSTSMVADPRSDITTTITMSLASQNVAHAQGEQILKKIPALYIDTAALRLNPRGTNKVGLQDFLERGQSKNVTSNFSIRAEWRRWTDVMLSATAGINTVDREDNTYLPSGRLGGFGDDTLGHFAIGKGQSTVRTGRLNGNLLTGRRISAAVGLEITQNASRDFRARQDTLSPGVVEPTNFYRAGQNSSATTTAGWFFEPKLNLNSRFFVVPGFRLDGGSAARGGGNGQGSGLMAFFPKLNFSWIAIDREGDVPMWGIISMLRPRVAFGIAGVQPEPTWSLRTMWLGARSAANPNQRMEGIVLQTLGNPELRPERSREVEGGFEVSLWNSKVNLIFSTYYQLRTDAIERVYLAPSIFPPSSPAYYQNIGRVRNTGLELSGDATVIETRRITVRVDGSFSTNQNIVTTLYGDPTPIDGFGGTTPILREGYPIDGRWGRPIVGVNQNPAFGRIWYDDYSLADTAVYLGSGSPKWAMPFGTTISLSGGLSVVARWNYTNGKTQFNSGNSALFERLYADPNATLEQQAIALAAAAAANGKLRPLKGSVNGLIQTVNSLRFNSLSVNYNIPRSLTARLNIPSASVSLQGSNLGLWTNYRGNDPDLNSIRAGDQVRDDGEAPRPRTWTVRVSLRN